MPPFSHSSASLKPRKRPPPTMRRQGGCKGGGDQERQPGLPQRTSQLQPNTGLAQVLNYEWRSPRNNCKQHYPPHTCVLCGAAAVDFVALTLQGHYKLELSLWQWGRIPGERESRLKALKGTDPLNCVHWLPSAFPFVWSMPPIPIK